jgi:aspartate/methionine/tyrosine aminotransferase
MAALPEFALERFFDRFEFELPFQLGSSDPETLSLRELLDLGDGEMRERWEALRLGYRTTAGDPELRAAIAATYADCTADDVLVTAGGADALMVACAASIEPGDRVVALTPAYQALHDLPRAMGALVDLVEIREDGREGGWRFPVERLLDALRPGVRALVLNVPHNPTGVMAAPDELRAVLARCEAIGARVIGDEVYLGLEWTGEAAPSVVKSSDRAVAIGVTSKVYGLAGLRIGWLVTRDGRWRRRALEIKDYTTLCAAGPSELLATIALRAHAPLLARSRERCLANLEALASFVAAHPDLILWRSPAATTVSVAAIAPALLARHGGEPERVFEHWRGRAGVLVVPGPAFSCAPSRFRLGFGRSDLSGALAALAACSEV